MSPDTKRLAFLAIALISVSVLIVSGFFALLTLHFHPAAPHWEFSRARDPLDAQRQDILYFRQLLALDRSFSPADRKEANRRLDALAAQRSVLDRAHFRVSLMRIDALADNGHSRVEGAERTRSWELPVRVAAFADAVHIMRTTAGHEELLGGRLVAIDGQSIEAVSAKLEQLRGGALQWRRLLASEYLTSQELLYGIDVAQDMQHSDWTVDTPFGERITRRLAAFLPQDNESVPITRWLSSEKLVGVDEDWQPIEPEHALPWSLSHFDTAFRSLRIPASCTQMVQLKSNSNQGGVSIKAFLADVIRQWQRLRPCNVILDMRYDSGGDYLNTYRFARELPGLIAPTGKVFVLTGPATFSAGITTIAVLKNADPQRVVILGEPVGDRLQFFSEGGKGCLPHSSLCVAYETGKHDYQHPCTDWDVCFWLNYFFDIQVSSLDPDELIGWNFQEWQAGVDPVMEHALVLAMVQEGHRSVRNID